MKMTIETKMLKPIKELNFDRLKELIFEYREIKTILGYEELPYEICVGDDFIFASDWVNEKLVEYSVWDNSAFEIEEVEK